MTMTYADVLFGYYYYSEDYCWYRKAKSHAPRILQVAWIVTSVGLIIATAGFTAAFMRFGLLGSW